MSTFDPDSAALLPRAFFARSTALVARELLGKVLVTRVGDALCAGAIVETEAYLGADDPGSHAATKGVTARNRVMYGPPGHAYVYFTYGNHHMLNLVTEANGVAGAVLVRAVRPIAGVEAMEARRGRAGVDLTNGPGKVAQAFGVDLGLNGVELGQTVAVYDAPGCDGASVGSSGRIGLSAGHELPLRYFIKREAYVSRGRTGPRGGARQRAARNGERT